MFEKEAMKEKENEPTEEASIPSTPEKKVKLPQAVEWLPALISSKHFFQPCQKCSKRALSSSEVHKSTVNYLCLTCADVHGICQLCMHEHAKCHILQIRRSSYHDVVREQELSKLINTEGIQTYVINSSQVVFLRERPQSRNKSHSQASNSHGRQSDAYDRNPEGCLTCGRHLHEGLSYCSLGCKTKHCTRGGQIGKQLPPGLELSHKPQGPGYWLAFQPHTPQLKPKSPSSYANKRQKHKLGPLTPVKNEGGYKASHLQYYTTSSASPHQGYYRHRRKSLPRQSPYK